MVVQFNGSALFSIVQSKSVSFMGDTCYTKGPANIPYAMKLLGSLGSVHASPWRSCCQSSLSKSTENTSINNVKIINSM